MLWLSLTLTAQRAEVQNLISERFFVMIFYKVILSFLIAALVPKYHYIKGKKDACYDLTINFIILESCLSLV